MDFLFGADMPLAVRFFLAFVIVLALIGGTAFLVRRFGAEPARRLGVAWAPAAACGDRRRRRRRTPPARADPARQCRASVDDRRPERRRGRGQHPARRSAGARSAAAATAGRADRHLAARRAARRRQHVAVAAGARACAAASGTAPRPHRQPPMVEEPMQWHPEPEPPPMPPMPARRHEPRMEPRRPRPEPRREPIRWPDSPPNSRAIRRRSRRPPAPRARPARERDFGRLREPSARVRLAPPPAPPAPAPAPAVDEPAAAANADQNLAEMAQRLEAALRRPKRRTAVPARMRTSPRQQTRACARSPTPCRKRRGGARRAAREVPPPPRLAPRNPNAATTAMPACPAHLARPPRPAPATHRKDPSTTASNRRWRACSAARRN